MENDKIIVRVMVHESNRTMDIEMPINITCNELVVALNSAYGFNIDTSDMSKCCLKCENPTVLLRGIRTLKEYGLRNGSLIHIL